MFNVEFEEVTNQFCAEFDTVVHTGDATLGEKTITANGVYNASSDDLDGYSKVNVNVPTGGDTPVIESLSVTPTTSQQTYNDSEVDGYKPVVVAAMPTGTEGTPTATKGAVSNHSVAVTPSVTNVAGYIAGGTKTGTAVTVLASELVSGTKQITANGTGIDVTNYAAVDVAVPNSYSAADEGKVVSNGALVAQTAHADVTPTTSDQTIDTTLNNSLKVIGDADLVAGNIKKDVEIFGVIGSYEGGGGDTSVFEKMAEGSAQSGKLTLPNVTKLRSYLFNSVTGDYQIESDEITAIENYCFDGSSGLNGIFKVPNCVKIGDYALRNTYIQTLFAPNGQLWGSTCQGSMLQTAVISGTKTGTSSNNYHLRNCTLLETVDVGGTMRLDNSFNGCTVMDTLVLRRSTLLALSNTGTFTGTPFASDGTGGTLYVPADLITSYQGASNWSTILGYTNNSIKSIESTHTDPNAPIDLTLYYADGTLIPT